MTHKIDATATGQFVSSLRDTTKWIFSDEELEIITKVELTIFKQVRGLQKTSESKSTLCLEKRAEIIKDGRETLEQIIADSQKASANAEAGKLKNHQLTQELSQLEKDLETTNKAFEILNTDSSELNTLLQTVRLHSSELKDIVERITVQQKKINTLNRKFRVFLSQKPL
jgi:methyl-accepting chemotaxis protein